ncbi:phosphatase PAP2 family protein [Cohnella sp. JJ-181]|uniref:phosphatase PAP2 family protein n=1 Tax=Cohnella rhizoplanae TaxID=2974897 RepID=UPI0022FFAF0F|nr:phosphatase PAP2 family protein [Cohnella sp. JJ-181]CAI6081163.1 hypothetical protein COHCIP112018_03218 [Cohnella sp. JJ-181]
MKLNSAQKQSVAAAIVLLLVLLGTITLLRSGGYGGWDQAAADAAAKSRSESWTRLWRTLSDMGQTAVIGGITLLSAACWAWLRSWRIAASFVGVVLVAYVSQMALKSAFGWDRPANAWGIEYDGYGYPSGNAAIASALYGWWLVLGVLAMRGRAAKNAACALAIALIAATGWSRIYFGVHYLSDVAAGYCVGGICALAAALICSWRRRT